ncbi:hypothetical protein [Pseudomonas amygdali]
MKITLIENGLDSLRKGYQFLGEHEKLISNGADDSDLFSVLKDAILNIQHGVEILFKHLLLQKNEFLVYTDISKLKEAYRSKAKGEISELYEAEGVHTVTFKESIDRLRDICGIPISESLKKKLLKVESWRNKITHSAAIITDDDVPKVLLEHLLDLDKLLAPVIGEPYLKGQGRVDLDRAYTLTMNTYGELANKLKAQSIEALISALRSVNMSNVRAPGVFRIKDINKAHALLVHLQNTGNLNFSCDIVNGHCSGHAIVTEELSNRIMTVYTTDNEVGYQFQFSDLVIYIPEINNNLSPLVFLYSSKLRPTGLNPVVEADGAWEVQHGLMLDEVGTELWSRDDYEKSIEEVYSERPPTLPAHKDIIRILSNGLAVFMNVRKLNYPGNTVFNTESFSSAEKIIQRLTHKIERREAAKD